jgi:hypothetical protein
MTILEIQEIIMKSLTQKEKDDVLNVDTLIYQQHLTKNYDLVDYSNLDSKNSSILNLQLMYEAQEEYDRNTNPKLDKLTFTKEIHRRLNKRHNQALRLAKKENISFLDALNRIPDIEGRYIETDPIEVYTWHNNSVYERRFTKRTVTLWGQWGGHSPNTVKPMRVFTDDEFPEGHSLYHQIAVYYHWVFNPTDAKEIIERSLAFVESGGLARL